MKIKLKSKKELLEVYCNNNFSHEYLTEDGVFGSNVFINPKIIIKYDNWYDVIRIDYRDHDEVDNVYYLIDINGKQTFVTSLEVITDKEEHNKNFNEKVDEVL